MRAKALESSPFAQIARLLHAVTQAISQKAECIEK